jgi:(p)ppGpp synthase/HD superfamily hydrolase
MQLDVTNKPIAAAALRLATAHHAGIERKYTGEAYITHPIAVAEILLSARIVDQNVLAAALLHDCLEDKNARGFLMNENVIREHCGEKVLRWVKLLTNTETGNRALRKQGAQIRIATAPAEVRCIKLADIIHNCSGISDHDPRFAETYLGEKRAMVQAMLTTGIPSLQLSTYTLLRNLAKDVIAEETNKLALVALANGMQWEEERKADDAAIEAMLAEDDRSVFAEVAIF